MERTAGIEAVERMRDTFFELIESAPFGVYVVDSEFRLRQVSEESRKAFSAASPLLGRDFGEVVRCVWPEPFASDVISRFRHALATGETYRSANTTEKRRDLPATESYDWMVKRIVLPDGQYGVVCYFYDVTARRAAEERATVILDSITDAFLSFDFESRYTYLNAQAERFIGKPSHELLGRVIWEDAPTARGTAFEAQHHLTMTKREPGVVTDYFPNHDRWYEARFYPAVGGISVFLRDVTEIKRAEQALRESQAQADRQRRLYEAILGNTPDLAYVFDLEHRFIYANEGLLKLWGRTWEQAIGRTCLEIGYEPWHAAMHDREIDQVKSTGQPIRGEVPFEGTFGRRMYDYIFVPVFDQQGHVVAVAGTTRDVTDRQQAELELRKLADELRESDQRKNEFLAMLAHELRNPLAPILNGLQIIRSSDGNAQSIQWATSLMQRQVGHMVRLVDDLLDVSRISRGKIELRRERVPLAPIIAHAVDTCRPTLDGSRQKLRVRQPEQAVDVFADPVRLAQVIGNLLNNACKYGEPGGRVDLEIAVAGTELSITVRDQGIGIPGEMLHRVFDMFTQVAHSLDRAQGGLGIGLTLVRSLVQMHDGSVTAHSDGAGKGSEFVVRMPIVVADRVVAETPDSAEPARLGGVRVLVVDDNHDAALSLAGLMQLQGATTRVAADGVLALQSIADFDPRVVLLDIGLPRLDGFETCRQLRALPRGADRVIVALTGWGKDEDRTRSEAAGFDAHLVKPVPPEQLLATLAGLLSGRQAA